MKPIKHPQHPNVQLYFVVFGVLAFLTVVTVAVASLHLPIAAGILVAMAIATLKAGLVATFFMHLKGERAIVYGLLGLTLFFVAFLFILPASDLVSLKDRMIIPDRPAAEAPAEP